jgi:hypothetical protein
LLVINPKKPLMVDNDRCDREYNMALKIAVAA